MELAKIVYRSLLQHRLRSTLTILGIAVALFAFTMIRTIVTAWYSGVEATAKNRLVVRNAVSLIFPLPYSYGAIISRVSGVALSGYGNWFGGVYKEERYTNAQFAVDDNYLEMSPEYLLSSEQKQDWLQDRKGIIVGAELARTYGIKIGDTLQLKGTIYPGLWEFNVRGVFGGRDKITDTRVMFFHWDYLNERNKQDKIHPADYVGFYLLQLSPGANAAEVSKAVDREFANSFAETLTETETAFVQGFISMSSAIISALNVVAGVVVLIMLLVLANTMLMSFRERYREFSILKSLGFTTRLLAWLVLGEAGVLGALSLMVLAFFLAPFILLPANVTLGELAKFFPSFHIEPLTLAAAFMLLLLVIAAASLVPVFEMAKMKVAEGIRRIG